MMAISVTGTAFTVVESTASINAVVGEGSSTGSGTAVEMLVTDGAIVGVGGRVAGGISVAVGSDFVGGRVAVVVDDG